MATPVEGMERLRQWASSREGRRSSPGRRAGWGARRPFSSPARAPRVVASGRDPGRGQALVDEIRAGGGRAEFVPGDVSLEETNERLVEECVRAFGGVDTVVACAGMLGLGSATDVPVDTWRQTLAVNLDAVFYLMRSALPALQARGGGSVVVVGSIAAFKGFPNHAAYCASKGALVALVRQVAVDYGPKVRVNLLCPGPVDTPLIWESAVAFPDPAKAVAAVGSGPS
jgi:NAD(P)-dependent dehydrogenase (short-subunit alcohol dehydrogenase family)